MKTLFIDCSMGAAGDMLTSALLELVDDADLFSKKMNTIGIPEVVFTPERVEKSGITGTHVSVKYKGVEEDEHHHDHAHEHHQISLEDIENIVNGLCIDESVKTDVMNVYKLIAEAESFAHGRPVTDIHFHEVGTMDAIADITAVCLLMKELSPDKVVSSPVHVGSGHVKCMHGVLPVPAPATAYILKGCPTYSADIDGELCTPTGAALLKYFTSEFASMPVMSVSRIGYGMGKKDFAKLNCVRAMLGENEDKKDEVSELACNIDDMTAEDLSFAVDMIFESGALDVYTTPAGMKKNRQGVVLHVLCKESEKENVLAAVFRHTSTIGIREYSLNRYTLKREIKEVETTCGTVRQKISTGYGVTKSKFEHDDLARIAKENNMSISEVIKKL